MSPSRRCTDLTDSTCPDCGAATVRFRDEVNLEHHLEATQLPITVDLATFGRQVWVWNPVSEAWISKFGSARDWRDHRAEHQCSTLTPRESEST